VASSWSPDGRQIVFASDIDGDYEIYVMDVDGTNWQQLTHNSVSDQGPSWSPDRKWIAFHSERDGLSELYRMRPDGSDVVRLTVNNVEVKYPKWSPDSGQLVYQSGTTGERVKLPIGTESPFYTREGILEATPRFYEKTRSVDNMESGEITFGRDF